MVDCGLAASMSILIAVKLVQTPSHSRRVLVSTRPSFLLKKRASFSSSGTEALLTLEEN